MRSVVRGLAVGALFALGLFALEGALVRSGSASLNFDTEGPFAALMSAVKPALPGLLVRIGLVYVLAGAVLGGVAGALAALWRRSFWIVLGAELLGLWGLLAWIHAIRRPALFDDVGFFKPVLAAIVRGGEPWHVWVAAGVLLAAHAVQLVRLLREEPKRVTALAGAAGLACLALLASAWTPPPRHDAKGPLFVLLGVDALRPDRLHVAPNLSAFVKDATLYTRAYTPIAQTEPAWRSLVTARWPNVAGSRYPLTAPSRWPKLPTFPEALEQGGIATYFETDCSRFNFQDESSGFTHRRQPPRGALNFALEKLRFRAVGLVADNALGAWLLPELVDNRAIAGIYDPVGYAQRLARRIVDAAGEGPALYAFHATAAHFPGDPVYPFYRQAVRGDAPLERRLRMVFTPIAGGTKGPAGWGRADSEGLYDELIAQGDLQVGIVLQALKDAGLYDDAYVIVFSDHGESFHGDSPELAGATPVHGARLSDEENRIFLAVKPGRAAHPEESDALVRLIDLGPTFLEAAGVKPLTGADGVALGKGSGLMLYAETGFTHASPAAFDVEHLSLAPRTFDAYRVKPNGLIEMSDEAHASVLAEKDFGAFDGEHWLTRAPLVDGQVRERCGGNCAALGAFLDQVMKETP